MDVLSNKKQNQQLYCFSKLSSFISRQFLDHGHELHAAFFACLMGGKARLTGSPKWLTGSDPRKLAKQLPIHSTTVEALDFSNAAVNYDGINNFGIIFVHTRYKYGEF
jgi:hypothetical protein